MTFRRLLISVHDHASISTLSGCALVSRITTCAGHLPHGTSCLSRLPTLHISLPFFCIISRLAHIFLYTLHLMDAQIMHASVPHHPFSNPHAVLYHLSRSLSPAHTSIHPPCSFLLSSYSWCCLICIPPTRLVRIHLSRISTIHHGLLGPPSYYAKPSKLHPYSPPRPPLPSSPPPHSH